MLSTWLPGTLIHTFISVHLPDVQAGRNLFFLAFSSFIQQVQPWSCQCYLLGQSLLVPETYVKKFPNSRRAPFLLSLELHELVRVNNFPTTQKRDVWLVEWSPSKQRSSQKEKNCREDREIVTSGLVHSKVSMKSVNNKTAESHLVCKPKRQG